MANFFQKESNQRPLDASDEVGIFLPPSTVCPSVTQFLGGYQRKVYLIVEYKSILLYFIVYIM